MLTFIPHRNTISHVSRICALIAVYSLIVTGISSAQVSPTAITFQGKLVENGRAANGSYDLELNLYSDSVGGTFLGARSAFGVSVDDGLFSVILDFGNVFGNEVRWLEVEVRPASGGSFSTLTPRQPVTMMPRALYSENAGLAEDADTLDGFDSNDFLRNTGGAVIGNLDVQGDVAASSFTLNGDTINQWPSGSGTGDNLGNHIATQNLRMNSRWISQDGGNEGLFVDNLGRVQVQGASTGMNLLSVNNGNLRILGGDLSMTNGDVFLDGQVWLDSGDSLRTPNNGRMQPGPLGYSFTFFPGGAGWASAVFGDSTGGFKIYMEDDGDIFLDGGSIVLNGGVVTMGSTSFCQRSLVRCEYSEERSGLTESAGECVDSGGHVKSSMAILAECE